MWKGPRGGLKHRRVMNLNGFGIVCCPGKEPQETQTRRDPEGQETHHRHRKGERQGEACMVPQRSARTAGSAYNFSKPPPKSRYFHDFAKFQYFHESFKNIKSGCRILRFFVKKYIFSFLWIATLTGTTFLSRARFASELPRWQGPSFWVEKVVCFDKKTQNPTARLKVFQNFMEMLKFR